MVTPEGIFKQADTHFTAWRWLVKKLCLDKESGHAHLRQMSRDCLKLRASPGAGVQDDQSTSE